MLKPIIKKRTSNGELKQSALHSNASAFQADIISRRTLPEGVQISEFLNPSLSSVDPSTLKDINKAATRIVRAISMGEIIGLVCDFEVDGVSSATILYESLVKSFGCNPARIIIFISKRMKHGYGLTPELMESIQATNPTPTLIITADQGSKDSAAITAHKKWAKKKGIISDIIVTDHHEIDEDNLPKDAFAFINPKQEDCAYPCKDICGAVVALLLMSQVRKKLVDKGIRQADTIPPMGATLPLASAATIADCSSVAQPVNRAFVKAGVRRMNADLDVCWKVFKQQKLQPNEPVTPQTIGFKLAPIINAASRMGKDGMLGVKYFLSDYDNEAQRHLMTLTKLNEDRKAAQQSLFNSADLSAMQQSRDGVRGLCIYQSNGNHGIHGIVAAGIAQKYGRPTIILSPKSNKETQVKLEIIEEFEIDVFKKMATLNQVDIGDDQFIEVSKTLGKMIPNFKLFSTFSGKPEKIKDLTFNQAVGMTRKSLFKGMGKRKHEFSSPYGTLIFDLTNQSKPKLMLEGVDELTGSARSVHGVSIKNIFERLEKDHPKLVVKCGGHDMAGGVTVKIDNLDEFKKVFDKLVNDECEDKGISLQPCYYSDGELPMERNLDVALVDELNQLEPFGHGFERPAFEFDVVVQSVKRIGETEHYQVRFRWSRNGIDYNAFWRSLGDSPDLGRVSAGAELRVLCEINDNYFRNRTVQLNVVTIID